MKILFLGYAVGLNEQSAYSGISIAGNKMQVNILKNLVKDPDVKVDCISILPYAPFPREKKIYIKQRMIEVSQGVSSHAVGFCNLPIIKQLSQTRSVYRQARKLADSDTVVLSFNLFPQVGISLGKLKKKLGCSTCAIIADLPIDDNKDKKPIRRFFRRIFEKRTIKAFKDCDKLIVVNKKAAEDYAPKIPYIVVEGGVDDETGQSFVQEKPAKKNLVYSGALSEYSGIMTLIDAMQYVDPDIELDIYGSGYLKDTVRELADKTANVKYKGTVSNSEMIGLQRMSYALVNPRPTNDPIAQVTFPSKIFEYMLSGRPVLTTRLNGYGKEYYNYLFFFDSEEPRGFAETINRVCKMQEEMLDEFARSARNFVVEKKNWRVQTQRIIDFLKS